MSWRQKLMRFLDPDVEDLRMQLREKIHEANAHADDLCRTIVMDGDRISKLLKACHENTKRTDRR